MTTEPDAATLPWVLASPMRLLAALFLVLALPMGALLYLGLHQLQHALESQARSQNLVAARLAAQLVKEHLDGSARYLASHARSPSLARAVARGDAAAIGEKLADIVVEQARFDRVYVTDAGGVLRYDFPPVPATHGLPLRHLDWFQGVARSEGGYVSAIYQRQASPHRYVIAIATPIRGPRGETLAYLVAQELAPAMAAVAIAARPTPRSEVVWVDRAGQAPAGADAPPTAQLASPLVRDALAGREGADRSQDPRTGQAIVTGYAPVPAFGGAVIVRQPLAEVFGPVDDLRTHVLTLALATLTAMIGLTALLVTALGRHQTYLMSVEGELRRSRDELEAVSYSLSHDLRTPLRGIDGFAQILLEEQGEQLGEPGRDHLQRVRQASQRMGQLLDDFVELLAISRAELRREPVDLSALAREVCDRLATAEPERRVTWTIEEGAAVEGDPRLLRRAVTSLLHNAWKFTRERDPAHIALRRVRGADGAPMATFVVEDDGAGFDMAYVERLFQPFERLHGPDDGSAGSGMGLAIVRRVIQRHGGRVWAEGTPGKGARFFFSLPT